MEKRTTQNTKMASMDTYLYYQRKFIIISMMVPYCLMWNFCIVQKIEIKIETFDRQQFEYSIIEIENFSWKRLHHFHSISIMLFFNFNLFFKRYFTFDKTQVKNEGNQLVKCIRPLRHKYNFQEATYKDILQKSHYSVCSLNWITFF